MDKKEIVIKTFNFARQRLEGESTGHDWWHTYRVFKIASFISRREKANLYIVHLTALLHDISDWKFNSGDDSAGPKLAESWLTSIDADKKDIEKVCQIIAKMSFKGAKVKSDILSLEGRIVQDADRLDAIGAIGIARAFAYGGSLKREIFNPKIKPIMHDSFEQYKKTTGTTINHFYEKLLLLKDRMNTKTGRKIAKRRHKFMKKYLKEFFREWNQKINHNNP